MPKMRNLSAALLCASLLCFFFPAAGQSLFPSQAEAIKETNPALRAAGALAGAQVEQAFSGLTLGDPEVSLSYMLGVPSDVPNRTNIEVTQPFDFATLSGAKRRLAGARERVEEASLGVERASLGLEAEKALVNYVYWHSMVQELQRQHDRVHAMHEVAERALEHGKITRLEYNRIALESISADADLDMARTELSSAASEIAVLAGGAQVSLPSEWPQAKLPGSFEEFCRAFPPEASPEIALLAAQVGEAAGEVEMRRKERMPNFSFGYTGELVRGANYHGAVLNFSLPLWGERGSVNAASARRRALELQVTAASDRYVAAKRAQYDRALALQRAVEAQCEIYTEIQKTNESYLRQALDAGTITVLEYMTEQEDFYTHALKFLEARRDFLLARADLYAETL